MPQAPEPDRQAAVLAAFARQAGWCHGSSPFTARLLERSRSWLAGEHEALATLAAMRLDPLAAAMPLRWAAGLHHLALQGLEPWASLWPRAPASGSRMPAPRTPARAAPARQGGERAEAVLDVAVDTAWREQRTALLAALALAPQTNEVQRSAALLPGLLHLAALCGRPLALVEIGASAGLNLWCERWHHDYLVWQWGDAREAPLTLRADWRGAAPVCARVPLTIASRAACDPSPVDLNSDAEVRRLASFVWPDQFERMQRLRTASRAAAGWTRADGVVVQAAPASGFLPQALATRPRGQALVLMHTVLWESLGAAEQQRLAETMAAAGAAATPETPLAWLRLEPPVPEARVELRCRYWAGGPPREWLLARAHPHGASIEWLAHEEHGA